MATLYQKMKLLQGLMTGEIARTGPFSVIVDVTRRCNLNCLGCRFHSTEARRPSLSDQNVPDVSFDMVKKLCEELSAVGTRRLFLLGEGEPLMHKRFFDMISTAKGLGFCVNSTTNGTLLDKTKIQALIDSRIDVLKVSFWASSPQEYEQQYPGADPGNFEKVVSALSLIRDLKAKHHSRFPSVILHQPINRNNFQKIDAMVDLALATGCDAVSFAPFLSVQGKLNSYSLSPDEERSLYLSLGRIGKRMRSLPLQHNIPRVLSRYKSGRGIGSSLLCYVAWFHSRIRLDGTVSSCGPCNVVLGDLKESSFDRIWNGPAYRGLRKQLLSAGGLAALGRQCDCEFCCFTEDHAHIHRLMRWFLPLITKRQ
jgi:MoaA/NifB/PqqE/SkfB family radical SAM enzyme